MELNDLKILLQNPEQLKNVIEKLRLDQTQSEQNKGFIALYDHFNGNSTELIKYIEDSERVITSPLNYQNVSFRYIKYAVVFLILTGIGSLIYFNYPKSNNKIVITDLYTDPGIPIYMSHETRINWAELMFAIQEKTPLQAKEIWIKIQKKAPQNDTTIYYGGIVYKNLNDSKKANYYFHKNLKRESVFHDQSRYFIAIAAWEHGRLTEAKKLLKELIYAENLDIREAVRKHLKNDFSSN
jgi:hypothetical protein